MLKGPIALTSILKKDKNGIRINHVEGANCMRK